MNSLFLLSLTSEKNSAGKSEREGGKEGGEWARTNRTAGWCSQSHSEQLGPLQGVGYSAKVLPCSILSTLAAHSGLI